MNLPLLLFRGGLYLMAAVPLVSATVATYLWREKLSRPWLFWILSLIALFCVLFIAYAWTFLGLGITGELAKPATAVDPIVLRAAVASLGAAIGCTLVLWWLRVIMGKRRMLA